uniref:Tudor domain-containing protein n=1 Tax=Wuchereria bancrofti TaxID=6293 RepID=A0A1I8F0F4_WUCBA
MVVLSLPMVSDFEGEISHVVATGNEAMIYVKPFGWWGEWEEINAVLQSLAHSLEKITSLTAVKSGEVYVVKVKDSFERSYIIRRPLPDIYLIDKGKQCEVEFGDIYEFPPVLLGFGMFSCICPVLMSSVEQINIYKSFVGYKCKCAVDAVSKSVEVIGFVRGRLLIEIEGRYKDLRDIVFGKIANRPGCSGVIAVRTGTEFVMEFDNTKTAFKHYVPEMLPVTVAVRFDKSDRMMNSFWVVSKKIFSAAERVLKEAWNKISRYPPISLRVQDIHVRQIPCIARARADTANKALYRAIPTQYDPRTKKVAIFLVDYGWFKWVLTNDVFDISTMDKSDPIRNLPVAMIHCREDTTSPVHAKDLFKGADCEIIIKGNAMNTDMYTVDLVGPFFTSNRAGGTSSEQRRMF